MSWGWLSEGGEKSVPAGQSDTRLNTWCYCAVPCNFEGKHNLPRLCVTFLFSGGKLLDSEKMASLLFGSTYLQLCPPTPLFWLEICLKAFPNLYGMKIFIVIAEIGTKGWAMTDCFCKALSGCFLSIGWASGGEGHNCRARRDQATGFAVNVLNREQKREEEIANHPSKTAACSEGDDVCNGKEDSGRAKSQEAITGLVCKAILQRHWVFAVDSVWFKDSDSSKIFSPFATTNVKCLHLFLKQDISAETASFGTYISISKQL